MQDSPIANATLRRFQGALCVIGFEGPAPSAFLKHGDWLVISQNGKSSVGCVLPASSGRRIMLRVEGGCAHMTPGESIEVSLAPESDIPVVPHLESFENLRVISSLPKHELTFSVVTPLRREDSYRRMLRSFRDYGFTSENTEFIAIDNRNQNLSDGYTGSRLALSEARGRYLIFCHDDVELLHDGFESLCRRLNELEARDPNWMIAGTAGGIYRDPAAKLSRRVSDRWKVGFRVRGPFPRRVESLDELLLLMPRLRAPQSSVDLSGFHFFGTDLCLQAELAGGRAYVIDFHLFHHGSGDIGPDYWEQKAQIEAKYRVYFPRRTVVTSTKPLNMKS